MGVLEVVRGVLPGLATAAGQGYAGYAADEQTKAKDVLAQAKAAQEAERNRVLNLLTQKEIARQNPGDAGYGQYKAGEIAATAPAEATAGALKARALIPVDVAKLTAETPGMVDRARQTEAATAPIKVQTAVDTAKGTAPISIATHEHERRFDNANQPPDKPQISIQQPLNTGDPAQAVVIDATDPMHPRVSTAPIPGVTKGATTGAQNKPQMDAARANLEAAKKTMDDYEAKLMRGEAQYGPWDATKGAIGSSEQTQTAKGLLGPAESLVGNYAGASLRGDNAELANYLKAKKFAAEAILNTHKRPNQTQYEIEQELSGIGPRLDGFMSDDAKRQIAQSAERRNRMWEEVFGGGQPTATPGGDTRKGVDLLSKYGITPTKRP